MPRYEQFRLPDAGEGLTEAEIVEWRVAVGDPVTVNQVIVEIETAKSLVELPCPFDGVVSALLVTSGETVEVGTPIITVDVDPTGPAEAAPADDLGSDAAGAATSQAAQRGSTGRLRRERRRADQAPPDRREPVRGVAARLRPRRTPAAATPASRHATTRRPPGAGQAAGPQARPRPQRRPRHGVPHGSRRDRHAART